MEPQQPDPDVERMLAFCAGDAEAFDQLFERWAGPLLRYLERMVSGETAIAEDLVQEAFLRVHGLRDRYEPRARFSTLLYGIATNLALNELDRAHRRHPHARAVATETDGHDVISRGVVLADDSADVEQLVSDRRAHRALVDALDSLPDRQRMAVWLAAAEGHSYKEVADTLDTSEKSVKALVHRARVALARRLRPSDATRPCADGSGSSVRRTGGSE